MSVAELERLRRVEEEIIAEGIPPDGRAIALDAEKLGLEPEKYAKALLREMFLMEDRGVTRYLAVEVWKLLIEEHLLMDPEIVEAWEKARERGEGEGKLAVFRWWVARNGPVLVKAMDRVVELLREAGVRFVVWETREGKVIPAYVKEGLLHANAHVNLLHAMRKLLQVPSDQLSEPRARRVILQNVERIVTPSGVNPPGYILLRGGKVLNLTTLEVEDVGLLVFERCIGLRQETVEAVKKFASMYLDWRAAESAYREKYCPIFSSVLEGVFPTEKEQRQFAEVTGAIFFPGPLRKAFVIKGAGGIGKSVLADSLKKALGDLACDIPFDTLFHKERGAFARGELAGRYANITSESPKEMLRNIEWFKRLTGDEELMGEVKHRRHFPFRNTCKHILFCNELPQFEHVDENIVERLYIIEATGEPPEAGKERPFLRLEVEREGVLGWVLLNYTWFIRNGARFIYAPSPEEVAEMLLRERNPVYEFVYESGWIEEDRGAKTLGLTLYNTFVAWCKESGRLDTLQHVKNERSFYEKLQQLGFTKTTQKGYVWFKGLRLARQEQPALDL